MTDYVSTVIKDGARKCKQKKLKVCETQTELGNST